MWEPGTVFPSKLTLFFFSVFFIANLDIKVATCSTGLHKYTEASGVGSSLDIEVPSCYKLAFEGNLKPPIGFMVVRKVGETGATPVTTEDTSQFRGAQVSGSYRPQNLQMALCFFGVVIGWSLKEGGHSLCTERPLHNTTFHTGRLKLSAATSRPIFGLPLQGLWMSFASEEKNLQMALRCFGGVVRWSLKIEAIQLSSLWSLIIAHRSLKMALLRFCKELMFKSVPSTLAHMVWNRRWMMSSLFSGSTQTLRNVSQTTILMSSWTDNLSCAVCGVSSNFGTVLGVYGTWYIKACVTLWLWLSLWVYSHQLIRALKFSTWISMLAYVLAH